jgi:hypothetical protein
MTYQDDTLSVCSVLTVIDDISPAPDTWLSLATTSEQKENLVMRGLPLDNH